MKSLQMKPLVAVRIVVRHIRRANVFEAELLRNKRRHYHICGLIEVSKATDSTRISPFPFVNVEEI